ncbi:MAG: anaerobic sulfatase maturase [Candidatus Electrothrix sp. AU1_5]|nr:anaerobic sulfatase maturase [Candidatus Electrothrix gigas]
MINAARKPLQKSVIIKPVGSFCNLQCDYCFYLETKKLYTGPPASHRMSKQTLEKIIQDMFASCDTPTFIWHGGEPTLMGLEFFQQAMSLQRHYAKGRAYSNALQTNGTLLNKDWANFFKTENFLVGVSLDGPKHVHNQYRKDLQGKGTFSTVFENTKMLMQAQVPVNVLATVNSYSVQHTEQIYRFFKRHKFIFMQFMPVVETDPQNPERAASYSVTARAYGAFLHRLFNLWIKDFDFKHLKQKTSIRFFDDLVKKYAGMLPDHCIFQRVCAGAPVIEHNGDMFSCDYMVAEDTHIGNIYNTSVNEALASRINTAFGERKAQLNNRCTKCKWLELCYGGCIKDRIRDPNDQGHNRFCSSYQFFFQKADKQLKKLAELYQKYY